MSGQDRGRAARDAALVAAAALVLYLAAGAASFGFVNYDDPAVVAENPARSWSTLGRAFTERMAHAWLPLYSLSLGVDNALFGPGRPAGYHLHSILLHALNAALVLLLCRRLGLGRAPSLLAGLLFAVHPVVGESVAWVASRKDLLSFALAAGAALVFLRAEGEPRRPRLHAAGAGLLALGMLAKGTVMVLPVLLGLAVLGRAGPPEARRRGLLATIPYFAAAGALAAVHMAVASLEGTAGASLGPADTAAARAAALPAVLGKYVVSLAAPWPLSVEHGIGPGTPSAGAVAGGACVLLLLLAAAVLDLRRGGASRGAGLALLGVLASIALFNGLFPRTSVLYAERYLYLPAAVACGLLGWAVAGPHADPRPGLRTAAGGVLVAAGAVVSLVHLPAWRASVPLWENAVETAPESPLARAKLGEALFEAAGALPAGEERTGGFLRAAEEHRRAAVLARSPLEALRARLDLGTALLFAGRGEASLAALGEARDLLGAVPDLPAGVRSMVEVNRALALESLGRRPEAIAALEGAVRGDGRSADALYNLGLLRTRAGDVDGAREALLRATGADPSRADARVALADVEVLAGDFATALRMAVKAVEVSPGDTSALAKCGEVAFLLGQPLRAEEWFRRALALDPAHPGARRGLAGALSFLSRKALGEGDGREAVRAAERATALDPEGAEPWFALGDALRAGGATREALEAYVRAGRNGDPGPAARARAGIYAAEATAARAKGDGPGARALLEKALAEAPPEIRLGGRRSPVKEGLERIPPPPEGGEARAPLLDGLLLLLEGDAAGAGEALGPVAEGAGRLAAAARVLRSRARVLADDLDGAVADLEALAAADPADARARFLLGHTLTARAARRRSEGKAEAAAADSDRAAALLEEARAKDPALVEASLALAEKHFVEGRSVDSIRELNGVLARDPDRVEAHLVLAQIMKAQFTETREAAFLEEARDHFRRVLSRDPSEARALAGLGELSAFANRPKEALAYALRALASDPDLPEAKSLGALLLVRVGQEQARNGEADAALESARKAESLSGESARVCLLRAEAHRRKGDWVRSGIEVDRARALDPSDPEVRDAAAAHYRDVAYAFLLHGRRDQAEEALRRAEAAGSDRVDLAEVKGLLAKGGSGGKPAIELSPEAVEAVRKAWEEAARLVEEGDRLRGEGKGTEAEARFRESLRAYETASARFGLGLLLKERGDRAGAEAEYRRAAALDPDYADAWLNLGGLLFLRGADGEAAAAYGEFLKRAPRSGAEETVLRVEALLRVLEERRKGAKPGEVPK